MANYEIVIRNETDKGDETPIASGGGAPQSASEGAAEITGRQAFKKVMAVGGIAASFVNQVVSYRIQTVSLRTGAEEQQERLVFAYSIAKQVGGTLLSTAVGAAMGGGIGAVVGLVVGIAHTAISYSQKAEELRIQKTVEDVGLRYLNARAGGSVASFSGSRLRNQ